MGVNVAIIDFVRHILKDSARFPAADVSVRVCNKGALAQNEQEAAWTQRTQSERRSTGAAKHVPRDLTPPDNPARKQFLWPLSSRQRGLLDGCLMH